MKFVRILTLISNILATVTEGKSPCEPDWKIGKIRTLSAER